MLAQDRAGVSFDASENISELLPLKSNCLASVQSIELQGFAGMIKVGDFVKTATMWILGGLD